MFYIKLVYSIIWRIFGVFLFQLNWHLYIKYNLWGSKTIDNFNCYIAKNGKSNAPFLENFLPVIIFAIFFRSLIKKIDGIYIFILTFITLYICDYVHLIYDHNN